MNLFIFVLNGFCVGISVLFAQACGMNNKKAFRNNFFISLLCGSLLTVIFSVFTIIFFNPLLYVIQTPIELKNYSDHI